MQMLCPVSIRQVKALVPGTVLPKPLQQALQSAVGEGTQAAITVLPGHAPTDIAALQQTDPTIREVLMFWRRKRRPSYEERRRASQSTLALLRQWDRLIEESGVLYCQVFRSDGGVPVLQLLLPDSLEGCVDPDSSGTWSSGNRANTGATTTAVLLARYVIRCSAVV